MARWLVARFPGGEMTGYPPKARMFVRGISCPNCRRPQYLSDFILSD